MSAQEIEEEIQRTRARMTGALNEIEARVSPARLKFEIQETLHDTVDKVREQIHPKQVAKRAGDNMLDTVRDNPVPALVAGISIGYMFMKGRDDDGRRSDARRRYRTGSQWDTGYEEDFYRDEVYPSRHPEYRNYPDYPEQYSSESEGSRTRDRVEDVKAQAAGTAQKVREGSDEAIQKAKHRAEETMRETRHRADETMQEARHGARKARRNVRRGARRAERSIEDYVHENPLMAGLFAAGAGAFLGSLLPSTEFEDRRIGGIRDDVMDDASEMAGEAKERAKNVADDAKSELKESGRHVAESAKSEARQMGDSA